MLLLEHLCFTKEATRAGKGWSLELSPGESLAVWSPNPKEYSAFELCRTLALITPPLSGHIRWEGQWVSHENRTHWSSQIGWLSYPTPFFPHLNAYQNLTLLLELQDIPAADWEIRLRPLILLLNLQDKIHESVDSFSPLEKAKLSLCRAVLRAPKLLVIHRLDALLDPKDTVEFLALFFALQKQMGWAFIWCTPHAHFAKRIASQLAVLHQGYILEQGPTSALCLTPQMPETRQYLKQAALKEMPWPLQPYLVQTAEVHAFYPVVQLALDDAHQDSPWMHWLVDRFDLNINVVQAYVDRIAGASYGIMRMELIGNPTNLQDAIEFLSQQGLPVEVLGYVGNTHRRLS